MHAVDDVSLDDLSGRDPGARGRIGLRQVDDGARLLMKLLDADRRDRSTSRVEDITDAQRSGMRPLRREMQMIFQDPYASLNPRQTVGQIIGAPFRIHKTEGETKRKVQDLMKRSGSNPEHYNRYPHEFSGGQRQRIGVARALALRPKLIVCDEPVSALDVSIQAQILNLLKDLQGEFKLTYLFISHDLRVVRYISDRIAVMYLGSHRRDCPMRTSCTTTRSTPTRRRCSRRCRRDTSAADIASAIVLPGDVPSPVDPPSGCPFHPRCPKARIVAGRQDEVPENCRERCLRLGSSTRSPRGLLVSGREGRQARAASSLLTL